MRLSLGIHLIPNNIYHTKCFDNKLVLRIIYLQFKGQEIRYSVDTRIKSVLVLQRLSSEK